MRGMEIHTFSEEDRAELGELFGRAAEGAPSASLWGHKESEAAVYRTPYMDLEPNSSRSTDRHRWSLGSGITASRYINKRWCGVNKSRPIRQRAADGHNQSVFGTDAAGVQCLTARLQHHQLREHQVVLVLFLDGIRPLQL
jgi:hypothetical protein